MGKLEKLDAIIEKKGPKVLAAWQFAKFSVASLIATAVEFTILNVMNNLSVIENLNTQAVDWFIFHYAGDGINGLGTMITFLVSTVIAQIVAFAVNRKKTFGSNMNLTFSLVIYFVVITVLICLQTYYAPQLGAFLLEKTSMSEGWAMNLSKIFFCFMNFVILFPTEKFIVMRRVEK